MSGSVIPGWKPGEPILRFAIPKETGRGYTHTFLSNGFIEPDGSFVEREYQAYAKSTDPVVQRTIMACQHPFGPNGAKKMGRKATLRPDFEQVKLPVMAFFVEKKFREHPELARMLGATGHVHLEEGNDWHDNVWGNCLCGNADGKHPECLLTGMNHLGVILMTIRVGVATGAYAR